MIQIALASLKYSYITLIEWINFNVFILPGLDISHMKKKKKTRYPPEIKTSTIGDNFDHYLN